MKKIGLGLALVAVMGIAVVFFVWRDVSRPEEGGGQALEVVATFYPLAYLAEAVGGERVRVSTLTPPGTEPHEYEPSPRDRAALEQADIVLYLGGIDEWVRAAEEELARRGVIVVRMSDRIALMAPPQEDHEENVPGEDGAGLVFDPHFWLDPLRMKDAGTVVKDTYIARDPANREWYAGQSARLADALQTLHTSYGEGLRVCRSRDMVVSHAAFGYLADRYDLRQVAIAGLSPEEEPSPRRLAEVAAFAKEQSVTTIFFETLVSPRLAETIARETGAATAVLTPIEGLGRREAAEGENYLTLMEENLTALRRALLCP